MSDDNININHASEDTMMEPLLAQDPEPVVKKNAYESSNCFSKLTFHWVTPLMVKGNKKFLEQEDHDPLRKKDQTKAIYEKFDKCWNKYKDTSKAPLYRTLASASTGMIVRCFFLQFFVAAFDLIKPVMIGLLIKYAGQQGDKDIKEGIALLFFMIMTTTFQSFLSLHADFQFNQLGYTMNNSVILALFNKSLKVSLFSNKAYKQGEIINLAQVDANRLYTICNQIAMMVFLPIQLVVGLWMVYRYVGLSFLAGLLVIFLVGVANYFMTKISIKYQRTIMKSKDKRMKITNEIFGQIKFIKVNAWEEFFYDRLDVARDQELKTLKSQIRLRIVSIIIFWLSSPLILNAVFASYTLFGNDLTAAVAFPVISLFGSLSGPIQGIPAMISSLIETHISVKRLTDYLQTEEIKIDYITNYNSRQNKQPLPIDYPEEDKQYAVILRKGKFTWGAPLQTKKEDAKKITNGDSSSSSSKQESKQINKEEQKTEELQKSQEEIPQGRTKSFEVEQGKSPQDKNVNIQGSEITTIQDEENNNQETLDTEQEEQKKEDLVILKDLELKVQKGKMVAIIGDVACGKSSLLYSMIGEMKYDKEHEPSLIVDGKMALVNQKPWVLSDTIRNNITFGQEFNQQRYDDAIKYSCMTHDMTVLTNGDQTMIGEKGVNLSGGQKARVALARAIYSDSNILLLDDILSAVDIHVGKSIVKDCLMNYKKNTTRILVTHAMSYMKYMDYIYMMKKGEIIQEGQYEDIKKSSEFQLIYEKFMKEQYEKEQKEELEELELKKKQSKSKELVMSKKKSEEIQVITRRKSSKRDQQEDQTDETEDKEDAKKAPEKDKYDDLILEEDRKRGDVSWDIYKKFISYNGGTWFVIVVLFASILSQAFRIGNSLWMLVWTENSKDGRNDYYLIVYSILSLGIALGAGVRASIIMLCVYSTCRKLHKGMTSNLIYAPLNEFFDRIPLGRILNRLSKDISILDTMIAFSLASFLASFFFMLGSVFLCVYASTYWVIIPILIYLWFCLKVYRFYITANRELVRLEGITKSPVVSYFGETLNGLHSVRAYNREQDFITNQCNFIDENKKNQVMVLSSNIWFRMSLSLCSIIINISSIGYSIFGPNDNQSMTGLLLTYAVGLDQIIRWMVMMMGLFEQRLVNFERCVSFLSIDHEPGYDDLLKVRKELKDEGKPMPKKSELRHWPEEGVIEFIDVEARYRANLDTVIKGISLKINKEEKIGIVGRTGAGKSTITLLLLRILELYKGKIIIDGKDISELSLDELRSKITTILQDPQLFEGSLRVNVDPLGEHSDQEILETLRLCNLQKLIDDREGLATEISSDGGNLSVGEKQLICIARALLKKSKIVLIDEATANIDIQTEHLVQDTIKKVFKDCTVLTIAHRINTILESDRILVLSNGKIEEFENPKKLLENPKSLFYQLHEEALKENHI